MKTPWFNNAIIYSLDVETFFDGNNDGIGDFPGLTEKLDYLQQLGVNCLWLLPFFVSPHRDNGYDIEDYFQIDPELGTMEDFENFMREAKKRNIKVIADLVLNHTSFCHPWFQEARKGPASPFYRYYVWSEKKPALTGNFTMFPGEEDNAFSFDTSAQAYYLHRFYREQPDLNIANPKVKKELRHVMQFWLEKGLAGFRVDAAHILVQLDSSFSKNYIKHNFGILNTLRKWSDEINPETMLIAEVNAKAKNLKFYFGKGNRMHVLFNFIANQNMFLAMAREKSLPLKQCLQELPAPPEGCNYLNFIRHHDELTLDKIRPEELAQVLATFAPEENMQIYGHGIRRRLPPMFGNNRHRIELINSLMFSLPDISLIRYGDEIGMGDDLNLPGRDSVRTVMQWSAERSGGFSSLPATKLERSAISDGEYGFEQVNVASQLKNKTSLLCWFRELIALRKAHPEISCHNYQWFETGNNAVAAMQYQTKTHCLYLVHNLSHEKTSFEFPDTIPVAGLKRLFGTCRAFHQKITLNSYGYVWLQSEK